MTKQYKSLMATYNQKKNLTSVHRIFFSFTWLFSLLEDYVKKARQDLLK